MPLKGNIYKHNPLQTMEMTVIWVWISHVYLEYVVCSAMH